MVACARAGEMERRAERKEMAEADRANSAKSEEVRRWLGIVEKEVAGLKLETKTKVTDDIARVWASNRQKIQMSKENQVKPAGRLAAIPMKPLNWEPSTTSSSGEDGEEKKRKREYAKVFSEKTK